ncbi:hypothetical protein F0562_025278 [Nyssa sinensis]|uniref:RRM domain-containing protein n=1 Tax=Nyssa sinensis TaxID=561372 RepID=A0A5J5BDT7_9ASTE|nr:hypothetical protein F0562_025278 [Nyssa sinensis]
MKKKRKRKKRSVGTVEEKMFYRGRYMDGDDGREMGPKRQQPSPFPIVRLHGLPFICSETNVADFFHGLDIVDVLFVYKIGKFTREASCVLRSARQEYYKAIANDVPDALGYSAHHSVPRVKSSFEGRDSTEHTEVLRLRGLPFSAGKDDITDFFKEFELSKDSIYMTFNSEGRPTGEAFAKFPSAEDSKAAMAKDRMTLGSHYIKLFPSSLKDLNEAKSKEVRKAGMVLNNPYTIGIPNSI